MSFIDTIHENKRVCRVLIGFMGASGAGKSSLINALLEQDDLLPADDEKACTAVCVEISYNHSKDSNMKFTAKVDRIGEDDWRGEIESLFKDISDQALSKSYYVLAFAFTWSCLKSPAPQLLTYLLKPMLTCQ